MKSKSKSKRRGPGVPQTHKTKDDFMRWWRKQSAHKKQLAEEQNAQALMVWADDGGAGN